MLHIRSDIPIWRDISRKDTSIPPLHGHIMVVLGEHVWVHGGIDATNTFRSSMWRMKILNEGQEFSEWVEYADQGAGARSAHCTAVIGERAFVWGGARGEQRLSCLFFLGTSTL